MLRRIIAFWGDLSLCSRPHLAAFWLLYLILQATLPVAYLIIIEIQFYPCIYHWQVGENIIPFPEFSRYDILFANHFLSSFYSFLWDFHVFL